MKILNSTGNHKIYFAAPANTEGLTDVKITLLKHDGTVLLNNVSGAELGDGVYEYNFNFVEAGWYVSQGYSESLGGHETESIRIGKYGRDYIYGVAPTDCTNIYEVNKLDDSNVMTGFMSQIGTTGIFYTEITGLTPGDYFFKMNHRDTARFNYPFKTDQLTLVIEPGYNISAYSGTGQFIFDGTAFVYVSSSVENTKASDLCDYIKYNYPDSNIRYIKSYYENPTKRFKIYIPNITPKTNDNNFSLVQFNQVSDPEKNAFYLYLDSTCNVIVECK
jgi:hypothetical protein